MRERPMAPASKWRESFAPGLVAPGCLWGHAVRHHSIGKSSTPRGSCGASNVFRHFQHKSKNWWVSETQRKKPRGCRGRGGSVLLSCCGFRSSFPLTAVFVESRCSMIAPGKYHMRTLRESQLRVYRGGSLLCPGSGSLGYHPSSSTYSRFPSSLHPSERTEMFHHPMTSSRRLSWTLRPGLHQLLYNSFIFYTFKKFFQTTWIQQ